jgi:hypothetical protein
MPHIVAMLNPSGGEKVAMEKTGVEDKTGGEQAQSGDADENNAPVGREKTVDLDKSMTKELAEAEELAETGDVANKPENAKENVENTKMPEEDENSIDDNELITRKDDRPEVLEKRWEFHVKELQGIKDAMWTKPEDVIQSLVGSPTLCGRIRKK